MCFIFCFVFRILSEQRFPPDTSWLDEVPTTCQMFLSVHCCMTKKSYLIKNPDSPGKKWCLAFNALFNVSNIVWPCFTCFSFTKIFYFHRYDPHALQICISWEKKGGKVCTFFCNRNIWMFDILNEHDCTHQFSC